MITLTIVTTALLAVITAMTLQSLLAQTKKPAPVRVRVDQPSQQRNRYPHRYR